MAKGLEASSQQVKKSGISDNGQDTKATRFNPKVKGGGNKTLAASSQQVKRSGIEDVNQDKGTRFSAGGKA